MISNVALQSTDAAASAGPSAGDTADTGVFDALMALTIPATTPDPMTRCGSSGRHCRR